MLQLNWHKTTKEKRSSYSSAVFIEHMLNAFPLKVECVQTDNVREFTKRLLKENDLTLFEEKLNDLGIRHKLIKPYTPGHNWRVERSHRKDNEYFYSNYKFYSFDDFKKQLAVHSRKYNNFPMRPLGWRSPGEFLNHFLLTGQVIFP